MSAVIQTEAPLSLLVAACRRLKPAVVLSLVSDTHTPVSVFHKLSAGSECGFLLESAEGDFRLARYSFVAVDPLVTLSFEGEQVRVHDLATGQQSSAEFEDPTLILKQAAAAAPEAAAQPESLAGVPFSGGLVGYMGYAATKHFEKIEQQTEDPFHIPDGFYGFYDSLIVFDHQFRRLHILSRRGQQYANALRRRIEESANMTTLPAMCRAGARCLPRAASNQSFAVCLFPEAAGVQLYWFVT